MKYTCVLFLWCLAAMSCSVGSRNGAIDEKYWKAQITDAEQELHKAELSPSERGSSLIKIGRAHSALKNKTEAMKIWLSILSRDDVDQTSKTRAQYRIALADENAQRWVEAINGYQRFSDLYFSLSEKERENFDQVSEHGAVLLFHAGELYEHRLLDVHKAEFMYLKAVQIAEKGRSINLIDLTEHLGDFYFRQKKYDKAMIEYEKVISFFSSIGSKLTSPASRPEYKILKSLMVAGRNEQARKYFDIFISKWGNTTYPPDVYYVEQASSLMK